MEHNDGKIVVVDGKMYMAVEIDGQTQLVPVLDADGHHEEAIVVH